MGARLAGLALGLLCFITPALATEADPPPPTDPPDGGAVDAATWTFEQDHSAVRARAGERIVWETWLVRPGHPLGKARTQPQRVGDLLYFCHRSELFSAPVQSGVIERRWLLPGACLELKGAPDGVAVSAGSRDGNAQWQQTYVTTETGTTIPFFAAVSAGGLAARSRARLIEVSADKAEDGERDLAAMAKKDPASLQKAIADLGELAGRDRTNPWIDFYRGEYLRALGRDEEARTAYRAALAHPADHDYELLAMATGLSRIDAGLGEQAWRRGMIFLLQHGYEPELASTLLTAMIHLGRPARSDLDPVADRQVLEARTARLRDLSPYAEGIAFLYQALADGAAQAGDAQAAAAWRQEVERARPYAFWGPIGGQALYAGYYLNALMALFAALLVLLALKIVRTFPARGAQAVSALRRFNPLGHWTRGELVGFLAAFACSFWIIIRLSTGVATIGLAAAMPFDLVQGNLGHPGAAAFLADVGADPEAGPGARFIYALSQHQAGRLDSAKAIYEGLDLGQAKNNLGVIAKQQGDLERARALWQSAASTSPQIQEAAFNLGQAAGGLRSTRAKTYGFAGPLLALPDAAMWDEIWQSKLRRSDDPGLRNPLAAFLAVADGGLMAEGKGGIGWTISLWTIFAAAVLALLALITSFGRAAERPARLGKLGWALGLPLPGAARQYALLGPPFTFLTFYLLLGAYLLHQSDGLSSNILDGIATPNFSRYYGASAAVPNPQKAFLDGLHAWFWVPLLANLLFVALAEKLRPDPAGWFAARKR